MKLIEFVNLTIIKNVRIIIIIIIIIINKLVTLFIKISL